MSHQDKRSDIVINHQSVKQAVDWLLNPSVFAGMKTREGATWKPRMLAVCALVWGIGVEAATLNARFTLARKIVCKLFRWQEEPGSSYQGFMKVLRKWSFRLQLAVTEHIRVQMKEVLAGQWKVAGYVVFAGDGSRLELSRTESLEDVFSPTGKKNKRKKNKKGKKKAAKKQSAKSTAKKENSPQMWLTLAWHVGTGLPWAWRTGPSNSSERAHLQEMLPELPEHSLITADAGFVGYDMWKAILDAGHHFVIRVGANVHLLKRLGYARQHADTVYLWPDAAAKRNRPPLVLRLIKTQVGKDTMYLVTNLTKSQLSDQKVATIYRARWGIELFFRTFKQTFGRRKLRGRSAENVYLEVDWSMLGLWCICLLGQRELAESGEDPARLSPAGAIEAVHDTICNYRVRPETPDESLWAQLRAAIRDDYERQNPKTSRDYPRKKKHQKIGTPTVTCALKNQVKAAQDFKKNTASRLPA